MFYFDGLQALKQNTRFTKRIRGIDKVFVGCYTCDFNILSITRYFDIIVLYLICVSMTGHLEKFY
jgi:hypothetical protein